MVRLPCSVDAGRTACTRPVRCGSVAPGIRKAKAPAKGLSTLNSMAFGLAVYASPDGLPHHDARLASSRWSDATGRAFTRRVPTKGFRMFPYISFPFPKLCLAQHGRPLPLNARVRYSGPADRSEQHPPLKIKKRGNSSGG